MRLRTSLCDSTFLNMAERSSLAGAKRFFCEHCDQELSKTSYFKHKKLFYDKKCRTWKKERVHYGAEVDLDEFEISDLEQVTDGHESPTEGKDLAIQ